MRPGFGPVLPGMRRRVGADVSIDPARGRTVLVVGFQRRRIVGTFVAEKGAKALQPGAVQNQPVPVVVADLMAKMTEQRAIWLVQLEPSLFPLGSIGFLDIERD